MACGFFADVAEVTGAIQFGGAMVDFPPVTEPAALALVAPAGVTCGNGVVE